MIIYGWQKKLLKNRLPKTKIILLQKQILTFKLKLKLKYFLQESTSEGNNTWMEHLL